MIQSRHGNASQRFDLVKSDFHILMLRSIFQNQSVTRNGLLLCDFTANTKQKMFYCATPCTSV